MPSSAPYKTFSAKPGDVKQGWYQIDATDKSLGRIAAVIATKLMGKDKPSYTAHIDTGDFVVVVNAEKLSIQARKLNSKEYRSYSGYPGGLRIRTMAEQQAKHPASLIQEAVRRMLPKTLMGRRMLSKLKVYAGSTHPHEAQQPAEWKPLI